MTNFSNEVHKNWQEVSRMKFLCFFIFLKNIVHGFFFVKSFYFGVLESSSPSFVVAAARVSVSGSACGPGPSRRGQEASAISAARRHGTSVLTAGVQRACSPQEAAQ